MEQAPQAPHSPMQQFIFEDVLSKILEKDTRYHRDAYNFLREALDFTQKALSKSRKKEVGHISAEELLNGIREYALALFGPMTTTVFAEWGIYSCEDFGNMVFLMVENNLLRKTEQDSPDDFRKGYRFEDVFRQPFLPSAKREGVIKPEPERAEVENN
jgi:uncharacterized repeat protein (TIGR04138 family)